MALPDIRCRRTGKRCDGGSVPEVNITRRITQHSPDGFEWGYGGSGPSDLALNVLHLYVPPGWDREEAVPLYRGKCSRFAWDWHQDFKREMVATIPEEGGTIHAQEIVDWIRERWPEYTPPG